MPIILIWNALAAPLAPTFKRILGDIAFASELLREGLTKRWEDAEKAEMLTRAYPVFRFTDEAVSAYVTRAQLGMALSGPPAGWGERLSGLGPAWNFWRQWVNRFQEARLLPRVFAVLRQVTETVKGSVARFQRPFPGMFNEVSAVDLFGMGAMAFRALGSGRAGLYVRMKQLSTAIYSPDTTVAPPARGMSGGTPPPDLPLEMQIDDWTREIAGALILLPAIGALAMILGPDLIQWGRHEVLAELADIESKVFDMRAQLFARLSHGVTAFAIGGIAFLIVARDYALAHIDNWVKFSTAYLFGLHGGLTAFVSQFSAFWDGVRELIAALIGVADQILAIDLTELIHRALVAIQFVCDFMIHLAYDKDDEPARYVAPHSFPVTVRELILGEGNGARARTELARGMTRMRELLAGSRGLQALGSIGTALGGINFRGLMGGLDLLGSRLNRPVLPLGAQPVLRYTTENEPDLVALVVRPAHAGVTRIVNDLGNTFNTELQATATGLTTMLDNAAAEFDRAAAGAARSGLHRAFRRMIEGADAFAAETFPLERQRGASGLAPLAEAFATGVSGAFRTMEAVLGGFLGFVMSEWRDHVARNEDTPVEVNATSPRILLERARLGRVHMPEMIIRLRAEELNQATAARVAARFAREVRQAYVQGEDKLSSWRAAAAPNPAPAG